MFREKSVIDEIVEYVEKNTKKGYNQNSLRWALSTQGYSKIEIEKAFKKINSQQSEIPVVKPLPQITYQPLIPYEEPRKSFWQKIFG
ncbi:hypothetical protein J4402_00040 [Candidatus Pacearchaeota archaeon]|nr:hypothetical protein [Candidatus Pacearchaeota archaeon]